MGALLMSPARPLPSEDTCTLGGAYLQNPETATAEWVFERSGDCPGSKNCIARTLAVYGVDHFVYACDTGQSPKACCTLILHVVESGEDIPTAFGNCPECGTSGACIVFEDMVGGITTAQAAYLGGF